MMRDPETTIGQIIDNVSVSIIGSVDENHFPNAKAMLPPRKREGLRHFYFTTNTSSLRVKQYAADPKACVYFFDPRLFKGIMFTGTMEVLQDPPAKQMIWRDGDEMYYPQGVTDPDYCVLKFTARRGRVYGDFASESFEIE